MNKYTINEYAIYKQIRFKWIYTTRRMMSSPPIFLRLNSISLFPPTCSIVAEYKCPNTALLYTNTTLVCSATCLHWKSFSLHWHCSQHWTLLNAHSKCSALKNVCIRQANFWHTLHIQMYRNQSATDLNAGLLAPYPFELFCRDDAFFSFSLTPTVSQTKLVKNYQKLTLDESRRLQLTQIDLAWLQMTRVMLKKSMIMFVGINSLSTLMMCMEASNFECPLCPMHQPRILHVFHFWWACKFIFLEIYFFIKLLHRSNFKS